MIRLCGFWLALAFSLFAAPAISAATDSSVEAVVIHQTMNRQGPEALLINDTVEVRRLSDLMLDNKQGAIHACGYHWLILFFHQDGSITTVAHNEECEEYPRANWRIHRILNEHFEVALNSPTHYLINIAVPSHIGLTDVQRALEDANNKVICSKGESARLPSIVVRSTAVSEIPSNRDQWEDAKNANRAVAKREVQKGVDVVQDTGLVESLDPLRIPTSSFGGMKISDTVERKLFLKYSASPRDVPKPPNGIEFEFPDPPEFYTIQFVSESPYSEELCKLLLAKLPPILDIALFPKYFQDDVRK